MSPSSFSLSELAERLDGKVHAEGEGAELRLTGIRALAQAGSSDLSFLHQASYQEEAAASNAAALLVPAELVDQLPQLQVPFIAVRSTQLAVARTIGLFHPEPRPAAGIHETAVIGEGCELGDGVHVGPYAVLGDRVVVGAGTVIESHVVIGDDCRIGAECRLRPHVILYYATEIGDRVQVHSGAVLGADGFGYASVDGVHHKVPQVGRTVLGDDVEVGANSAVDRALLETTSIGPGSKIDNLVQVGHNVQTGKGCLLCGQVGIGGSSEIEDYVVLGGQVGVADHVHVGRGAQVAAKSAVYTRLQGGLQAGGIPAVPIKDFRRQMAASARLPDLLKRVRRLEKQLEALSDDEPASR